MADYKTDLLMSHAPHPAPASVPVKRKLSLSFGNRGGEVSRVNIKNYTSDVPAGTTINRIQNLLIEAKVNGITMEYGAGGEIIALLFHVKLDHDYSIRLTANVDGVQDTL